ncbi:LacI family DNA-binding transcriptional regulator [Mesorhizobium sp. RP14(2022)]|uniref:LacI family DNA-binding transcriptional regulator n=1 Tax=Mesorhizobium liriopis TaxID=2953882 RepID=A0ABT1CCL0_9HYPH|nr:LacI family DNA-binding transcriptional regulator [Mesorhizobium liriopis]MCO6052253.1 LacI family DNA-binding transcriptional regulator [Mesorhizobium liriopis]
MLPRFDEVVRVDAPSNNTSKTKEVGAREGTSKPIRIEGVALEAGVSPITVSRALRASTSVSPATRERVLAAVRKTGYVSNPHASALRSGRSTIVAAFLSNLVSQQYNDAATACAEVLEDAGFQLMIGQTAYSYARETAAVQSLRALKPAGIFFSGVVELEANRRAVREFGVPVVESWAFPRDPIDMLVGISNTEAGCMAADHFVGRGRRRLAFVGRSGGRGRLRLNGFRERARELNAEIVLVREVDHVRSISDGRTILRELASYTRDIDAVFIANDLLAIGALLEAPSIGVSVPHDLSILGIGDSEFAARMTPSLSVVAFDASFVGRRAGQLIASRLSGTSKSPSLEHVPLSLVERGSS